MRDNEKLRAERMASLSDDVKPFVAMQRPSLREMGVAGMREFGKAYTGAPVTEPAVHLRGG